MTQRQIKRMLMVLDDARRPVTLATRPELDFTSAAVIAASIQEWDWDDESHEGSAAIARGQVWRRYHPNDGAAVIAAALLDWNETNGVDDEIIAP